jgi:AraC-like DNA-binding protein
MALPFHQVENSCANAFCMSIDIGPGNYGWHTHRRNGLIYAISGILKLEVESAQWLLPPQRAAWVPVNIEHETHLLTPAKLRWIVLDPSFPGVPESGCKVFSVTPLFREMIIFSQRWVPDRDPYDTTANLFFQTLAVLSQRWMDSEQPFRLPRAKTPEITKVIDYTLEDLVGAKLEHAAQCANLSTRTLRRRMKQETGLTWNSFLHNARMMQAMTLLTAPDAQVTEVAFDVGYHSLSAFSTAFTRFTGETPREYRQKQLMQLRTRSGVRRRSRHHRRN